jgi:hypothetical protein
VSNVKTLARVVIARRRLRDLSAGEVAMADAARIEAEMVRMAASRAHEQLLEDTGARVAVVDSVRGLEQLQDERTGSRLAISTAYAEVKRRSTTVNDLRQALNRRERDLRGSEKQLDGARHERNAHLDKVEQQASDERSSAMTWRNS